MASFLSFKLRLCFILSFSFSPYLIAIFFEYIKQKLFLALIRNVSYSSIMPTFLGPQTRTGQTFYILLIYCMEEIFPGLFKIKLTIF